MRWDPILDLLRNAIGERKRLILAVSGGADSMALLTAAAVLRPGRGLELAVAHLDHGLRAESADDSEFVREACARFEIPVSVRRADPPRSRKNLEAWGREQRYAFFAAELERLSYEAVLVAHHEDDQIETFLMRLGSGRPVEPMVPWDARRSVLRPFLTARRAELRAFLEDRKTSFVEDSTNADPRFLRNRVRREVIPALERTFGEELPRTLAKQLTTLASDRECLSALADVEGAHFAPERWDDPDWVRRVRTRLGELHPAIGWRVIQKLALSTVGYPIGPERALEVLEVVRNESIGAELAGGISLRREGGSIRWVKRL